jgi:tetratricopeptide (TPR) repeat protein
VLHGGPRLMDTIMSTLYCRSLALCCVLLAASPLGCTRIDSDPARVASDATVSRALCQDFGSLASAPPASLTVAVAAARLRPDAPERWTATGQAWLALAQSSGDAGLFLQVRSCADAAQALQREFLPAAELHAAVLLDAHRFAAARDAADAILARDPDNLAALGIRSDALLELGQYEPAIEAARAQMRAFPGAAAQARGAWLRWLHGDVEGAKRLLVAALRGRDASTPEFNAWLWHEIAQVYWRSGDVDGADQLATMALSQWSRHAPALLLRARIALARQRSDEALSLARASQASRATLESAVLIGDALAARGDAAAAESAWRDAERIGLAGDRLGLARLLAERDRDPARALNLIDAEAASRGGIALDDARAWANYRLGRCDAARAAIASATRLGTRDPALIYHDGAIAIACGAREAGRRRVAEALRLHPQFDPFAALEARALLATPSASTAAQ